jgi:hypothetical protein
VGIFLVAFAVGLFKTSMLCMSSSRRLSQAKDFEEALRIQTAFMHSQLNVLGKQATSLGEAYTKAAVSKASKGSSD